MAMFGDVIQKLLVFLMRPEAFTKLLFVAARVSPHMQFEMFVKSGKSLVSEPTWMVKKDTGALM